MTSRPNVLHGTTPRVKTGCGWVYLTINRHAATGKPIEVIARIGKAGGCVSANFDVVSKLVTRLLIHGERPEDIAKLLAGTSCHRHNPQMGEYSCADSLAQVLKEASDVSTG